MQGARGDVHADRDVEAPVNDYLEAYFLVKCDSRIAFHGSVDVEGDVDAYLVEDSDDTDTDRLEHVTSAQMPPIVHEAYHLSAHANEYITLPTSTLP